MNAFYDIWIGSDSAAPRYAREKGAWVNTELEPFACWVNASRDKKFIEQTDTSNHSLIVLGQFYEPIDNKKLLRQCLDYVNKTESFFEDPAGHYIIFLIDKAKENCHVFTNRLGTYHAYYLSEKGNNTLSTYYLELARRTKNKALDWEGITGFLGMGFFPGNTTYLKKIKILEPSTHYCFNKELELVSSERYWNWSYTPSDKPIGEYIDHLDQVLRASVGYAATDMKVAIPISGGLDSRTIAGVLTSKREHHASSLWGFSYGYDATSVETRIAERIARSRQIPFNHYIVPNYLFDRLDSITDSVELFQYVDGTRQACMSELLQQNSDVVLGGHWGDVWMDNMGVDNYQNDQLTYFHKKIIKKGSQRLLTEVADLHMPNSKQYLDDYFMSFMSQYRHIEDVDFRMKIYKTEQWSFRWTLASIRMYQAGAFPILPFYDKRIAELFTTIPTSQVKGRYLQIEYLKKYHPDLARIKWQEYGSNLYLYKWLNNRNIVYRAIDKAKRMVSSSPVITRNWEIFYLNPTGRKNLENILLNTAFNNIVPAIKVKALLDEFYQTPSPANGYAVSTLLTFAQFIKTVF